MNFYSTYRRNVLNSIVRHPAPPSMTLHANAKQIPVSISIVSYVYHLVGVYLVVDLVVYFHVLAMG